GGSGPPASRACRARCGSTSTTRSPVDAPLAGADPKESPLAKTHAVAVIPGDGIGPEVVREGLRVLERVAASEGFAIRLTRYPFGAEHYLATKEVLPDSAFEEIRGHDAILLGAIGDPRIQVGLLEFGIIARMRFGLDLYVNLRPVKLYAEHLCPLKDKRPEDVDFVVVCEIGRA